MSGEYEAVLENKVLARYGLTPSNVPVEKMTEFLEDILSVYSRSRGLLKSEKIDLIDGESDYELPADFHEAEEILWNDTYPSDAIQERLTIDDEAYYFPSLRLLGFLRDAMAAEGIEDEQEYQTYKSGAKTKVHLYPEPTTDIWLLYRTLFTKENYPREDDEILETGLTWKLYEYVKSTGLYRTLGKVEFDNAGIQARIDKFERDFQLALVPAMVSR